METPNKTQDITSRDQTKITTIVIHHTATDSNINAEAMKQSMYNTWVVNRHAPIIPAHYIIDKWGNSIKINNRDKNVRSVAKDKYNTEEQVIDANLHGIHIELVGDFNKAPPSELQYQRLQILIKQINDKAGKQLEIKGHSDYASKNCPGKLFDFNRIRKEIDTPKVSISKPNFNKKWRVTQYTPCAGSSINDSKSQE